MVRKTLEAISVLLFGMGAYLLSTSQPLGWIFVVLGMYRLLHYG